MDVMMGLTAVSKGLDIVRTLRDIEVKSNDAAFKLNIADLHGALADAKIALADAKEALAEKDRKIRSLEEVQAGKMPIVRHNGFSFGINDDGSSIGRPFCPTCEQQHGLQIQIMRADSTHDLCPKCHGIYSDYTRKLPEKLAPKNIEDPS